jgi:hypothetical protein
MQLLYSSCVNALPRLRGASKVQIRGYNHIHTLNTDKALPLTVGESGCLGKRNIFQYLYLGRLRLLDGVYKLVAPCSQLFGSANLWYD